METPSVGVFSFLIASARRCPEKLHEAGQILLQGETMPNYKFTWKIDWNRRAGWTESFYRSTSGTPGTNELRDHARTWASNRARVLTAAATIQACRISDVTIPRAVQIVGLTNRGALGSGLVFENIQPDVVNVAQLVTFNSTASIPRYYLQRGLDDRDVIDGQITYAENGKGPSTRFWNYVQSDDWRMRDLVKSTTKALTLVNGATKIAIATNWVGYAENSLVLVESRTSGNGLKMRWQGKVDNIDDNEARLKGYRFGNAEGGTVSLLTATFPNLTEWSLPSPNWARTRETGRPFDLSRGRASKRT